jgi:hypothetical protein
MPAACGSPRVVLRPVVYCPYGKSPVYAVIPATPPGAGWWTMTCGTMACGEQ